MQKTKGPSSVHGKKAFLMRQEWKKMAALTAAAVFAEAAGIFSAQAAEGGQAPSDSAWQQEASRRRAEEMESRRDQQPSALFHGDHAPVHIEIPKEPYRFRIHTIRLKGAGSFSFLQPLVSPYEGQRIGAAGAAKIAALLEARLMQAGYVTSRVEVPDQDLSSGALLFQIHPGYIEDIRFDDPAMKGTWRNAFPAAPGSILNVRSLEQGLEQMQRVPGQHVTMTLLPGQKRDHSVVLLHIERDRDMTLGLSLDDGGTENTGKMEAAVSGALYNPAGWNDIFSWTYGKDTEHHDREKGTDNYSVSYSLPLAGNYTLSLNRYHYKYRQTIAALTPYRSEGTTDGMEAELSRTMHRDSRRKTDLFAKVIRRNRHSYINGEELSVQKQKTTALRTGIRNRVFLGETEADWQVWMQQGVPWMGAEPAVGDGAEGNGTTRYRIWGGDLQITAPFYIGKTAGEYRFILAGQYTKNRLFSTDQMAIGGRWTVRGFDGEMNLSAENGWYMQHELAFPIQSWHMTPYLAVDMGRVWGPSDEWLLGHTLAGAAAGIRGTLGNHLQYDFFLGVPLHKPDGFHTGKTAAGFSIYMEW